MALVHLVLVAVWAGVLAVELTLEAAGGSSVEGVRRAAWAHYWIDLWVEVPVVLGVLLTGMLLALSLSEWTNLHLLKFASALVAIAINLSCVGAVIRRRNARDDADLLRWHRRLRLAGLGFPPGILAAYIGLAYFH